ncbi:MAG: hypothetical protein AAF554_13090 [Bacteroidota bacterium]
MRIFKIIIGFLLLSGAGKEYVEASGEAGSWASPGIIIGVLLVLLLCTWLIGTGFVKVKYKLSRIQLIKYFGISLVIFFCFSFFHLSREIVPSNFVTINGLKVPLNKCIDGNERLISDETRREEFCKCFVEKLTDNPELKMRFKKKLESGRLIQVFNEIQNDSIFLGLGIDNCYGQNMEWTTRLAELMKKKWKEELTGTEFEKSNDLDKYCNCLIDGYKEFPFEEVIGDDFANSPEAVSIDEKCTELSKK